MVVRLATADEELSKYVRRWAEEGTFRSWHWAATAPFEGALLAVTTPGPLGFLVAFCQQDGQRITPLLLLKNAVPLYETPEATDTDGVSERAWTQIRSAILMHNPGLVGCLNMFEGRYLREHPGI